MIIKCNNKESFKASVRYDKKLVVETLLKDTRIKNRDFSPLSNLLERIDSLSKMKEDSIVEILPFDRNGQATLVCNIYDKNKKIQSVVEPRSAIKLLEDADYREKYFKQARLKIKSVFNSEKQIEKLAESILELKNIKGFMENKTPKILNKENLKNYLVKPPFSSHLMKSNEEGFNPLKQILSFFKSLNKNSKGQELFFEISSYRTPKGYTQSFMKFFSNKNEVRIPLDKLFEKPPEIGVLKELNK